MIMNIPQVTDESQIKEIKKESSETRNSAILYLVPNINNPKQSFNSNFNLTNILIALFTLILFGVTMTIIAVLKRKELDLFYDIINSIADSNDTEYLDTFNATKSICDIVDFSTFNIVSHPFAFLLIILYMFLFWRRSCCINCLFGRPAAPMIISPYKKSSRFYSAVIYGIIAFDVMEIVQSAVSKTSSSDVYGKLVQDPSGLFKLLIRLVEMLVAALRYYPPLIAFYSNSFIIYLTSAIYMLTDLGINSYVESINLFFFS